MPDGAAYGGIAQLWYEPACDMRYVVIRQRINSYALFAGISKTDGTEYHDVTASRVLVTIGYLKQYFMHLAA